jgi:signal transduction histidine kinase
MRLVRLVLLLDLLAATAVGVAVLLAMGAPLAARGALRPGVLAAIAVLSGSALVGLGAILLERSVARPVERLLAAADRLAGGDVALPVLEPPGEPSSGSLSRAALAFERVATALTEERARLASKVEELELTNQALAAARESWLRSERLATVGRLASGVAHEVGNPLGAISGYTELARERLAVGATAEAGVLVARIGVEAQRIDRIVRDMLDFARPTRLVLAPVTVHGALDAALRLARMQTRFRAVEVATELSPDLPLVLADEGRLAQVFLNVLLNAGDAMAGEGRIDIRARAEGRSVAIELADRGPGVDPADLPRIFDPFFTTKAPGAGTGLGLAICYRIVESFGGEILARNAPEGGAVFSLRLKAASLPEGAS